MKFMPIRFLASSLFVCVLSVFFIPAQAQPSDPEMYALDREWYRLASNGQYDSALSILQQRFHLAEQRDGLESESVARTLGKIGDTYLYKNDDKKAQTYFSRALVIYERLPDTKYGAGTCEMNRQLGMIEFRRNNVDSAAQLLESALACMETKQGTRSWISIVTMNDLGDIYRSQPNRPDMAVKADQLFQRWFPIVERTMGPNDILAATLLGRQAKSYAQRKEWLIAWDMRSGALEIIAQHSKQATPDPKWQKLEADLLLNQVQAYRAANGYKNDPNVFEYQARLVAAESKHYGVNHPRTEGSRKFLERWRSDYFYVPESVRTMGGASWLYDDADHDQCLDVQAIAPKSGNALAYGRYRLINNCDYRIKLSACITTDRADGTPSPNFNRHKDDERCPGMGWGGMELLANEKKDERTWFEYSNIKWDIKVCKEGWDFAGEDGESMPINSPIGGKYTCRKLNLTDTHEHQSPKKTPEYNNSTPDSGVISYDPVTGRCLPIGSPACCAIPGIGDQEHCSSSQPSRGSGRTGVAR